MANNSKSTQKQADAKRSGQRTRNWTVIFYPDDLPGNWQSEVDSLHCKWVEGPPHNKCYGADGKLRKTHVHSLFMFDVVKTEAQVLEMLATLFPGDVIGSVVGVLRPQKVTDRSAMVRYFAHMDHPEKTQYDPSEIKGHNGVDPVDLIRYSATETRMMVIAMEEFIEENSIVELSVFSKMIRYENPEWHTILSTKMTTYFTGFIRSRRHMITDEQRLQEEREGLERSKEAKRRSREAKELDNRECEIEKKQSLEFDEDGVLINDLEIENEDCKGES